MNLHEQLEAGSVRWALIFPEGMPEDVKPWVVQAVRQALALDRVERERLLRERIEARIEGIADRAQREHWNHATAVGYGLGLGDALAVFYA